MEVMGITNRSIENGVRFPGSYRKVWLHLSGFLLLTYALSFVASRQRRGKGVVPQVRVGQVTCISEKSAGR